MSEVFLRGKVEMHCGDCLDVLKTLPDNSVDSCVTDPPYHLESIHKRFGKTLKYGERGLDPARSGVGGAMARLSRGFMGQLWDGGDIAFRPELWAEVLRVLKPGAHLLAFGGTRTYHRMACAIEDAGFEIRDCIQWLYGSGFPKSHDVSKGIDRAAGAEREIVGQKVRGDVEAAKRNGVTMAAADANKNNKAIFGYGVENLTVAATAAARQWEGWGTALKPCVEMIVMARKPLSESTVAENVLRWGVGAININVCRVPGAYQPILGGMHRKANPIYGAFNGVDVTGQRPYTDAWENEQNLCASCAELAANGMKPTTRAIKESIATRPVERTLNEKESESPVVTDKTDIGCSAGMTAANIDISLNTSKSGKILTDQSQPGLKSTIRTGTRETTQSTICASCGKPITEVSTKQSMGVTGRWPGNLIHDGSEEVVAGFPDSDAGSASGYNWADSSNDNPTHIARNIKSGVHFGDSGSAARFFYTAKADSDDRLGSKHPTVKPLDLMQYLVRLVTPKGGVCLDPFAGTGTTGEAAWREGCKAVLIEREAEYQADIRRRMELALSGPDERTYQSAKARQGDKAPDYGPLFDRKKWDEMWAKPFDKPELL